MNAAIVSICLLMTILNNPTEPCTVFSAVRGGRILAAKNQDYDIIHTRMLVIPSNGQKYGVIHFGDQNPEGFCNTSGMNDQGLWYAGASVPERTDISNHYNKPTIEGELIETVLEQCANVEQAIDMFRTYYTPEWDGHWLLTDKLGNSVVVEYGENDVVFIPMDGDYQVATNFYLCDTTNARWHHCYRYETANYMLENSDSISVDLFRSICDATHLEGPSTTVLSTIHDLITGDIYIYDFHNFDEVVKINLQEELAKGEQYHKIPEFFHHIQLVRPNPDERVDPTSVKFQWKGDGNDYLLYCSSDSDFSAYVPVEVASNQFSIETKMCPMFLFIGMMLFGGILSRKKQELYIIICLTTFVAFLSCGINILEPPETSKVRHSAILEDLQSNTTYYWKVVAVGENGINSESVAQTFKTRD